MTSGDRFLWFIGTMGACVIVICLLNIPFDHIDTERSQAPFDTQYVDNNDIELGNQKTTTDGVNGTKQTTYKYKASLLSWLFDKNSQRNQGQISSEVIVRPVTQIVQKGTLKYQYMWCSNGTARFYTKEQFTDPQTGFTSISPDYCAQNGQGHKIKLATALGPRCKDVTSYDYNWNNDMLCTNADGSTFYTSYGGAASFLRN